MSDPSSALLKNPNSSSGYDAVGTEMEAMGDGLTGQSHYYEEVEDEVGGLVVRHVALARAPLEIHNQSRGFVP